LLCAGQFITSLPPSIFPSASWAIVISEFPLPASLSETAKVQLPLTSADASCAKSEKVKG
jgi:hypothetical protein